MARGWKWSAARDCGWRRLAVCLVASFAGLGCHKHKPDRPSAAAPPTVRVVHPTARRIVRVVGQPSFVESYERTSVFPKLTGFIESWKVDIGDRVKKDQVLATLFVPEIVEDHGTKVATVELDKERIDQALKVVEVAKADVEAAEARLEEARSILAKYQSQVDRWDSEVERLTREMKAGVVDPQVQLESTNQLKASTAARDAAEAAIKTAEAELLSRQATLMKDNVDVAVARADLVVAESEERRLKAWVGYITLAAPFDGIIVARNANTGDFVMPVMGDPTAMQRAPYMAPDKAAPIYVVDRTDVVRVFVDVPERDANYVQPGTKARVFVEGFRDDWFSAEVTRVSWALNVTSRTLRAEIDLLNEQSPQPYHDAGTHETAADKSSGVQMLPGMYAYAKIDIERNVRALPRDALVQRDGKSYFWRDDDGKARRMEVQTGIGDDHWIEVLRRRPAPRGKEPDPSAWAPVDGSEQAILGDLASLAEGTAVKVAQKSDKSAPSDKPDEADGGDDDSDHQQNGE